MASMRIEPQGDPPSEISNKSHDHEISDKYK